MEIELKYQTYLINLDRATERLAFMQNEFKNQLIDFERITAVDAITLDSSSYLINNKYDRRLVPGEIGCYLSHIKALKTFLNSANAYAIVIEDDAILHPQYKYITEKAIRDFPKLNEYERWDVLKLFNGKRHHIKIRDIDSNFFIAACGTSIPITTIAAIWTREAAIKFLDKVCTPIPVIKRPIDCDLQHAWEFNLKIYNLLPTVVTPAPVQTQIQISSNLKKAKLFLQIKYELGRVFPKYLYLIRQHGFTKFYNSFIVKKNLKIK